MATADNDSKAKIQKNIEKHKRHQIKYTKIKEELEGNITTENPQLSTSDPDSRHQIVRGMITEVCYTAQTTVDEKNNILVDYKITNQNDKKAMGMMLRRAKSILKHNNFTALYDKGYHTGSEFHTANTLGIQTLVAIPNIGRASQAPDPKYNVEYFKYDKHKDCYICPQEQELTSNQKWYKARNYKFKQYKTKACKTCPVRNLCTTAKVNGKIVQRSQYAYAIEDNAERVKANEDTYKKRQAIVEHPFGTIKRQWGFDHIITKRTITSASADFGLIALAYNLKRIINILKASKSSKKQCLHYFSRQNRLYESKKSNIGILKLVFHKKQEVFKIAA